MSLAYSTTKTVWRAVVPKRLYRKAFNGRSVVSRAILHVKSRLEASASHDQLYDEAYFARQDEEMAVGAVGIAASLVRLLDGSSDGVIDVGCGSGAVMAEFAKLGVPVVGLEYAQAAIARARAKQLRVEQFDLERPVAFDERAPLVLSTEVAEHLPAGIADAYVDLLVRLSTQWVVITAATPGQGGTDHVNEQPNEYWIEKFARRGMHFRAALTEQLRLDWKTRGVDRHRANNALVFER